MSRIFITGSSDGLGKAVAQAKATILYYMRVITERWRLLTHYYRKAQR